MRPSSTALRRLLAAAACLAAVAGVAGCQNQPGPSSRTVYFSPGHPAYIGYCPQGQHQVHTQVGLPKCVR
jgi:hypothetical protein